MRPIVKIAIAAAALCWLGCSTTSAVVKSPPVQTCKPSPSEYQQIFDALNNPVQAAAIAAVDALKFTGCIVLAGINQIIDDVEPKNATETAIAAAEYSPVPSNAKAWKKAHGFAINSPRLQSLAVLEPGAGPRVPSLPWTMISRSRRAIPLRPSSTSSGTATARSPISQARRSNSAIAMKTWTRRTRYYA